MENDTVAVERMHEETGSTHLAEHFHGEGGWDLAFLHHIVQCLDQTVAQLAPSVELGAHAGFEAGWVW